MSNSDEQKFAAALTAYGPGEKHADSNRWAIGPDHMLAVEPGVGLIARAREADGWAKIHFSHSDLLSVVAAHPAADTADAHRRTQQEDRRGQGAALAQIIRDDRRVRFP